jgi:S-formylglutathione hydrolase FrmB
MGHTRKTITKRLAAWTALAAMVSIALVSRGVSGQFNEERRRGELTPIVMSGGAVVEFKLMKAETLGGIDQPYSIFLPPSYTKEPTRTYPVVYFLHGLNNDHTSWTVDRYGHLQNKVEEMILAGKIPEIIMVHPRGDNSFYCNYVDGTKRYEDYVVSDLVNYIQANYRAKKERRFRSIGGTSMGGYGALKIAMKFPDRYSAAVGQSPIIFPGQNPLDVPDELKSSQFFQFFAGMLRPLFGEPLRQDLWDLNNPLVLARRGRLDGLSVYFDYGTDDRYIPRIHLDQGAQMLDRILTEAKVNHTFKIHPGEPHGWQLVASHLGESLPFLCRDFR